MELSEKDLLIVEMALRRLKNMTELSELEEKILQKIANKLDFLQEIDS